MAAIVSQSKLDRLTDVVDKLEKGTPFRSWFQTTLEEVTAVSQSKLDRLTDLLPVIDDLTEALLKCRVFALSRATPNTKFSYFFPSIPELVFKARIHRQLKSIKEKLKSVKEKPEETASRKKVYGCLDSTWAADSSNIIGFDARLSKLRQKVASERFIAIAIVGVGGSGKTALAQKVLNSFKDQEFEVRVWVSMSRHLYSNDYKSILSFKSILLTLLQQLQNIPDHDPVHHDEPETNMLHQVQNGSDELDELEMLKKIRRKLEGRSYLIVLDGVHHVKDWLEDLSFDLAEGEAISSNKLAHGLPKRSGNGAVIVTTREEEAAVKMVRKKNTREEEAAAKKNIYRMDRLGDDECWEIFKNAFGDDRHQDALNSMKKDIYSDCQGLPLVAKALGTIIRRSELATNRWD